MKVNYPVKFTTPSSSSVNKSENKGSISRPASSEASESPVVDKGGVNLSNSASFVQGLRDVSQEIPEIRVEEVEQAKADIESGTLGSDKDYDQAVTALLLEL